MKNFSFLFLFFFISTGLFSQTEPPQRINYQGVLRDSIGNPLNGEFSFVFSFYNSDVGGTLLWQEEYNDSYPPKILVGNGLFTVLLGDPSHRTSGSESSFVNVFSKYANVYLGIKVESDPEMTPRIMVVSSAFSQNSNTFDGKNSSEFAKLIYPETISANWSNILYPWEDNEVSDVLTIGPGSTVDPTVYIGNSDNLDGFDSSYFLNTSSTSQTKTGTLNIQTDSNYGIVSGGYQGGGIFYDNSSSGIAYLGYGDYGITASGTLAGGYFTTPSNSSYAYVGYGNYGIDARGNTAGAYFKDKDGSGYAYVGYGDNGIEAQGNNAGGYFKDANGTGYSFVGYGDIGISGFGSYAGAYFKDDVDSGSALIGYGNTGIEATGTFTGGYFYDFDGTSHAYISIENKGIEAFGNYMGIDAQGNSAGGYFKDANNSGFAYVGYGDEGIEAWGNNIGGYFRDSDNSGYARVGFGDYGIDARGNTAGAYFTDNDNTGYAYVGYGDYGIDARGNTGGGYFKDLNNSGFAYVGFGELGIQAEGILAGGYFNDIDNSVYGRVGNGTYKIYGNGSVNFVQNHPYEKDKVIVYAAPEGDEVATYTRGTGKLLNGEARIKLGETFKWVTNPDIGLTAYLTPVGEWADLYISEKSTEEIVVKSRDKNSNATFDYIIFGLRIGFEEASIVQEKERESYIPSFKDHRELFKRNPSLYNFTALERFKNMESSVKGIQKENIDLSRAIALKEAIHEFDPEKDAPISDILKEKESKKLEPNEEIKKEITFSERKKEEDKVEIKREEIIVKEREDLSCFKAKESIEEGDVLIISKVEDGFVEKCKEFFDPYVLGVASKEKECKEGEVYVKTTGIAYVKVDSSFGKISKGDLIVTSVNYGYGMKGENAPQGTVLGKALDNLGEGNRKIKVLLHAR